MNKVVRMEGIVFDHEEKVLDALVGLIDKNKVIIDKDHTGSSSFVVTIELIKNLDVDELFALNALRRALFLRVVEES